MRPYKGAYALFYACVGMLYALTGLERFWSVFACECANNIY